MKTFTVAEARQDLSAVIGDITAYSEHVLITKNGKPAVVMMTVDEYEALEDTIFWLSVPGVLDQVVADRDSREREEQPVGYTRMTLEDVRADRAHFATTGEELPEAALPSRRPR
jgi:prevent-host-death family protein